MINVSKPFLPPLGEYIPYLEKIWTSRSLTNNGPYVQELELALSNYLDVPYISLVSNATVGLLLAFKACGVTGEVITSPYSFVASSNILSWCGLTPVFVDVDPNSLNIDPEAIRAAINTTTSAILPIHVYGNPCDILQIEKIALENRLKVVYDASHAFGVRHEGQSILSAGDFAVVSFHATKIFNTFEGGAVISKTAHDKAVIDRLRNFGFSNEIEVDSIGINGKMPEVNAALGLLQLGYIDEVLSKRELVYQRYINAINDIEGVSCLPQFATDIRNYAYFPVFINAALRTSRDDIVIAMRDRGVNVRRYFYPLITEFDAYKGFQHIARSNCPKALYASQTVICLPMFPDLLGVEQELVIEVLKDALRLASPSLKADDS